MHEKNIVLRENTLWFLQADDALNFMLVHLNLLSAVHAQSVETIHHLSLQHFITSSLFFLLLLNEVYFKLLVQVNMVAG